MNEFERWWTETYLPEMRGLTPVFMLIFKEVAQKAWDAGHAVGIEEAR